MGCAESTETGSMEVVDTDLAPTESSEPNWFTGQHQQSLEAARKEQPNDPDVVGPPSHHEDGSEFEEIIARADAADSKMQAAIQATTAVAAKENAEAEAAAAVSAKAKVEAEQAATIAEMEKTEAAQATATAAAADAALAAANKEGDEAKIAQASAAAEEAAKNAAQEQAEAAAAQEAAAVEAAEAEAAAAAASKEKAEAEKAAAAAEKAKAEAAKASAPIAKGTLNPSAKEFDPSIYATVRLTELKKVFDAFDLDGNGTVEFSELKCVGEALHSGRAEWSEEQAKRRYATFDTDADGEITFSEYARFYRDILASDMSDEQFMRGCDDMLQSALKARALCEDSEDSI